MIWLAPVDNGDVPIAAIVTTLHSWAWIQLQIRGNSSIYVAKTREELDARPNGGIEIRAGDAPLEFHWKGAIWGLGAAKNASMDIQIHE